MKYIFVHIPKTAGTSFRISAKEKLKCIWDYGPDSPNTSDIIKQAIYGNKIQKLREFVEDKGVDLVSGHFHASKYKNIFPNAGLVTFVRNPVDRVLSEYNHLVRNLMYDGSIDAFVSSRVQRNKQYSCFSGFEIADFLFVGLTEQYSESLIKFNMLTDLELRELRMNRSERKDRNASEVTRNSLPNEFIQYIKEKNSDDFRLYQDAQSHFRKIGFDTTAYPFSDIKDGKSFSIKRVTMMKKRSKKLLEGFNVNPSLSKEKGELVLTVQGWIVPKRILVEKVELYCNDDILLASGELNQQRPDVVKHLSHLDLQDQNLGFLLTQVVSDGLIDKKIEEEKSSELNVIASLSNGESLCLANIEIESNSSDTFLSKR